METEFNEGNYGFYEPDYEGDAAHGDYVPTEEEWKMLQDMATTIIDDED